MQVHQVAATRPPPPHPQGEVPHKPGEAGRRQQRTGAALRPPPRRDQPQLMKVQPTARSGIQWRGSPQPNRTHSAVRPSATPANPTRPSRRIIASANQGGERLPDSPRLGMNPRAGVAEAGPIGGRVTAGDEHHRGGSGARRAARRPPGRPDPAVECRAGRSRSQDGDRLNRRRSARLPHRRRRSLRPVATPESRGPEGRMVVDDQHCWTHAADRPTCHWGTHCGQHQYRDREPPWLRSASLARNEHRSSGSRTVASHNHSLKPPRMFRPADGPKLLTGPRQRIAVGEGTGKDRQARIPAHPGELERSLP